MGQGLRLNDIEQHPVTVSGCDGLLASSESVEIWLNSFLATTDRLWFSAHIAIDMGAAEDDARRLRVNDLFNDLQTWNDDALLAFRKAAEEDSYDLNLVIDGRRVNLELCDGTGGGVDDGTGEIAWRQRLMAAYSATDELADLELRWPGLSVEARHTIDLVRVREQVRKYRY